MRWIVTSLRGLRETRVAALMLTSVVFVTALLFATAPRVLERTAAEVLRSDVAGARSVDRNIQVLQERRIDGPGDGAGAIADAGMGLEQRFPATVRALIADRYHIAESPRWSVLRGPPENTLRLRFQPGVEPHLRLVEGTLPTGPGEVVRVPPDNRVVFEAAVSVETARQLNVSVGQTLPLGSDDTDLLTRGHGFPAGVRIVGLFEVIDPAADYWLGDPALARPTVRPINLEESYVDSTALLAQAAYPPFMTVSGGERQMHLRYTWRYRIDPARLDAGGADALRAELRRLESTLPAETGGSPTTLRGALLSLVERYLARWGSAQVILAVVATGAAAVAAAALTLVTVLASQRRRSAVVVWRARGGSALHVLSSLAVEGLLLAVPVTIAAVAIAVVAVPGEPEMPAIVAASLVAAVAVCLMVALASARTAPSVQPAREQVDLRRTSPRRLAVEALVIILAVVGAYLVRQRGVRGASGTGELAGADPFIAAVPALCGVAVGLVAMRALPLPMRAIARIAAEGRGLVGVHAMRRLTRGASGGAVLMVLLATVAISTFASMTLVHLDRAADAIAWQEVGAPFRVQAPPGLSFPADFDPAAVPGVEEVATASSSNVALAGKGARMDLLALDTAAFERVTAGTLGDQRLPDALFESGGGAVPVIISRGLSAQHIGLETGSTFPLTLRAEDRTGVVFRPVEFVVVEIRDSFPSLPVDQQFAVASRQRVLDALGGATLARSTFFVRAPDATGPALRDAARRPLPTALYESRADRAAALHTAPVLRAVFTGVALAAAVAAAYAALGVASALALAGAARALEFAQLRALGLDRGAGTRMLVVEHTPTVALSFVLGVALGAALYALVQPALGLPSLTGSTADVPLQMDPLHLAAILVSIAVVFGLGIGVAAALQRRVVPAGAVRRGFE